MACKPLDLPPEVAKAFIEDVRAFFAEKNSIKRDEPSRYWMSAGSRQI